MYLKLLCFPIISLVAILKVAVSYNVNNAPQLTNATIGQKVGLFCLTDIEDYQTIIWYKIKSWYSVAISPSSRYTWYENNQLMIINTFKTEDAGEYFCGVIARNQVFAISRTYSNVVLKNDNNDGCEQYTKCSFYQPQEIICMRYYNTALGQQIDIYHCSKEHQQYFQCNNPRFIAISECTPCLKKNKLGYVSCGKYGHCVPTYGSTYQCACFETQSFCWSGNSVDKSYPNNWHELKIINRNRPVLENLRHLRHVISKTLRYHCNRLDCRYEVISGTMNKTIDPWLSMDSTSVFFDLPKNPCTNIYNLRFNIVQTLKDGTVIVYSRSSINVLSHIFLTRAQEDYTIFFVFDLNGNRYIDDNLCPDPTNATMLYTHTTSSPTTGTPINPRQDHSSGLNTVQISALSVTATFVLVVFFCLLFRRYRLHRTLTTRTNLRTNINASNNFTNTALAGLEGDIAFISYSEAVKYTVPPPYSEIDQNKEMSPPSYDQIANVSN